MKRTNELSARIHAAKSELDRLTSEIDRCNAAINAADEPAAQLQQLQKQRSTEIARAFVESRTPDLAAIDNLIRVADESGARAREQGEAAREALQFIEQRRGELEDELATARKELTAVVLEDLTARRVKAQEAFNAAINAASEPFGTLLALNAMERRLRDSPPSPWTLLDAVKERGICVFGERGLQSPDWFAPGRSNESYLALADEFRAVGLEV